MSRHTHRQNGFSEESAPLPRTFATYQLRQRPPVRPTRPHIHIPSLGLSSVPWRARFCASTCFLEQGNESSTREKFTTVTYGRNRLCLAQIVLLTLQARLNVFSDPI